ncbi:MAG: hypothetical protein K6E99_01945 [Bacilli bacterium]|nr:hypothetical protein [Bacilli bacterium]
MKKKIILCLCLLFIPFVSVSATGISVNSSNITITKGDTRNITVTVTNLAALLDVTSSNTGVVTVKPEHLDLTSNGSGSVSGTITITGVTAGNANVTIKTYDATDFTEGEPYNQTVTIKVTVNNPTSSTTTTTTTTKKQEVAHPNNQQKQEQTTRSVETSQESIPEIPQEQVVEETTEIVTTSIKDENSNGVDDEIEFASLKIVGYPIEFDSKVNNYTINIGEAKAIYLSATPLTEGAIVDKNGEVNVEGLNSIDLTLTYNEKTSKITINLNRSSIPGPSPKIEKTSSSKFSLVVASIEGVIILLLVAAFIYKDQILSKFSKKEVVTTSKSKLNIYDEKNIKDPIKFDKYK